MCDPVTKFNGNLNFVKTRITCIGLSAVDVVGTQLATFR